MDSSAQHSTGFSAQSLPVLTADTWHSPLTPALLERLAELLPAFIISRRWFRAKARTITRVLIEDVIPFAEHDSWLMVLLISYTEGEGDRYLLPVSLSAHDLMDEATASLAEVFASLTTLEGRQGVLHSAFANPRFRRLILDAIAENRSFAGLNGTLMARGTKVPVYANGSLNVQLESSVSRAEQSNTSIIYGDQFILKLFRKVEAGTNPDIEVAKFLTEHGFGNTPAVLGTLEYQSTKDDATYAAGILQKFVRNQGDAWKFTLDSLGGFFQRALSAGKLEAAPSTHPLEQMSQPVPPSVQRLIGNYLDSASLLGKRTAEMHAALGGDAQDADFAPEPFTERDAEHLYGEMVAQANTSFAVLRLKLETLTGAAAHAARQLLASEGAILNRFLQLKTTHVAAHRIRFHGDYHLGQVLFTGSDFMIIDFEGEPARPLSERRSKTICLRDVAGMVRSFQYAGYASLFGQVPGLAAGHPEAIEAAAALWNSWVTSTYLDGYFNTAGNASFLPPSMDGRRILLDAFLLHKALYEVAYELNNRPDWVIIPLRGILGLIG